MGIPLGEPTRHRHVVRSGSGRESLYLKTDLAWALDRVDGVVETRSVPPQIRYRWPLAVGVEWEQTITRERPVDRTTETYTRVCRVEAEETVTVPAGRNGR